ncbi:MFS general substrate transporter [Macroventuria anomochaeta]|uniref:MFS general substrate transporter n=1 Tax=Macroventuria anomochaeta TaxID=301207 RepID=A0ACB6SGP8_9PLEO|nr:MFS general substrate transporter [Macroventuria anomochaeta]KAF2632652.1 MFS general substrate transporter [Macroventuria anomochaeta]
MGIMGGLWKQPASVEGSGDAPTSLPQNEKNSNPTKKWNLGILSDPLTDEVPGSVILLSKAHNRNEPLGLQHAHARTSTSSLPSAYGPSRSASRGSRHSSRSRQPEKKRTKDGKFILEPQPEESANDPLNWKQLRRDAALISLGFYCMLGGGMTPVLAAGFNDVAETYGVGLSQVALTTGLYMLGLGLGSVLASPTAILYGKRPVYLVAIVLFTLSAVWCALSPNYASLVIARIVQGFAVSPVECLPSATIAEIFFLHERAYRLGMYTLLLLGGKNLIPLVSAAIVQSLGWRWVFWIVAIVVGFSFFLIFFFVPETFWDRTPRARGRSHARSRSHSPKRQKHFHLPTRHNKKSTDELAGPVNAPTMATPPAGTPLEHPKKVHKAAHVGFADDLGRDTPALHTDVPQTPRSPISIHSSCPETPRHDYFPHVPESTISDPEKQDQTSGTQSLSSAKPGRPLDADQISEQFSIHYTDYYRTAPAKTYRQSLRPWNGRLAKDKWVKVMVRPFILFAYPAVLWSSLVYALAVGWLIVLSESVAHVYQNRESYNFTALQVGLVYISPFVGGVLGTAVAGKVSDLIVRFMARRNDGVYEPEFRLVMAIPITISTVIGLMGFGWSAEEKDLWIVPTIFFGVISFGCCLASTTAITFVVDSYRVYAGEALVTLNFCKSKSSLICWHLDTITISTITLTTCRRSPRVHLLVVLPTLA